MPLNVLRRPPLLQPWALTCPIGQLNTQGKGVPMPIYSRCGLQFEAEEVPG